MPLELRKQKDGKYRPHWYGCYKANGKRHCVNLGVEVAGAIPKSLKDIGDPAFERSRAKAQAKLESIQGEAANKRNTTHILEKIYELKSGSPLEETKLSALPTLWINIPRSKSISKAHALQTSRVLERFVAYLNAHFPHAQYLSQVSKPMAHAFLKQESDRGIAPKTYNDILKLLRSAFLKLLQGHHNPFEGIPSRAPETKYRRPFTESELSRILENSKANPFIRPIIILGLATAMRRGDCCLLRWENVDLKDGFIRVKTSKTGHTAEIPIFPILREELTRAKESSPTLPKPEAYVFPEQAKMYITNADGITWRVNRLLKNAGLDGDMQTKREQGLRKASVISFHSFRVTWITLALSAGIPLELVRRVTGHQTTEIVLKHYFHPNREQLHTAFNGRMPEALTGSK